MPPALQVVNFFKQGLTGGALEPLAPGTGDSNTFQNANGEPCGWLADARLVDDANPCEGSLIASRFHDQILGIAGQVPSGATLAPPNRSSSFSPPGYDNPIYASDVLTFQVLGTAGDNVNGTLLLYYKDLPGIKAVLSWAAIQSRIVNLVGVDVSLDASSNSQGDWSQTVALSAAGRRLDAGKYYAVLGFTASEPLAAMAIQGFETGNIRVGGSVIGDGETDANLFARYSQLYNAPLIPVINANNQDNVLVSCADPAASTVATTVLLAQLDGIA